MFKRAPKFKNQSCDNCNSHQFVRQVGCGKHYECLKCYGDDGRSFCGLCLRDKVKYGSFGDIVTMKLQSDFDLFAPFRKRQNYAKGQCSLCDSKQTQYLLMKNDWNFICALCENKRENGNDPVFRINVANVKQGYERV